MSCRSRSSQTRLTVASRKARSCDATSSDPDRRRRCSSSHSSASRSRWFVGSSRSSRSGIGDDQPCERRPRLLAARQRRRRLRPFVAREPEPAQRAVDPLVERVAAEDLVLVEELGVGVVGDPALALHLRQPLGHPIEVGGAGPDRGAQVRRGHERLVEVRLLGEQPEGQPALAMDLAAVGLVATGGQAQQRRLAGAVRADEPDPVAERDRRVDRVEDDERADLAGHARQAQDAHRSRTPPVPSGGGADARAAARRVAAARFVRSVRARRDARAASSGVSPSAPHRRARSSARPPGAVRRSSSAGSPRRPSGRSRRAAGTTSRSASIAPR